MIANSEAIFKIFEHSVTHIKQIIESSNLHDDFPMLLGVAQNTGRFPDFVYYELPFDIKRNKDASCFMFNSSPPSTKSCYIMSHRKHDKFLLVNGGYFNPTDTDIPKEILCRMVDEIASPSTATALRKDIINKDVSHVIGKSYDVGAVTSRLRSMSESKSSLLHLVDKRTVSIIISCDKDDCQGSLDQMKGRFGDNISVVAHPDLDNYRCLVYSRKIA
jgi:hypothetical protein